ncbi:DUF2501 domain-containing protein [Sodalis sp.]|uniref:DUF2501 domain-containing protein n=1 Tax=Sodalis sp. (in: enterobacteria) TaxID=1898979 RepID=UPI003873C0F8
MCVCTAMSCGVPQAANCTVKDQLLDKLGINNNTSTSSSAAKTQDYQSGLAGS